jgi:hypothetical protein
MAGSFFASLATAPPPRAERWLVPAGVIDVGFKSSKPPSPPRRDVDVFHHRINGLQRIVAEQSVEIIYLKNRMKLEGLTP